jgi:hypothetical protein
MKARSFRFRIVVWSVLVSGAVLIAFSWVTWLALQQSRGASLDESLAAFGFRHATKASKNADTTRFESSMVENFGEDKAETRFLAFLTREDEVIYRSQHWPEDVAPGGLPRIRSPPRSAAKYSCSTESERGRTRQGRSPGSSCDGAALLHERGKRGSDFVSEFLLTAR